MSTPSADFNGQIIEEFHANQGRVGGGLEGVPLLLRHHAPETPSLVGVCHGT
jgi:hypothetical protein